MVDGDKGRRNTNIWRAKCEELGVRITAMKKATVVGMKWRGVCEACDRSCLYFRNHTKMACKCGKGIMKVEKIVADIQDEDEDEGSNEDA